LLNGQQEARLVSRKESELLGARLSDAESDLIGSALFSVKEVKVYLE